MITTNIDGKVLKELVRLLPKNPVSSIYAGEINQYTIRFHSSMDRATDF